VAAGAQGAGETRAGERSDMRSPVLV
jgi:hypothetical protein